MARYTGAMMHTEYDATLPLVVQRLRGQITQLRNNFGGMERVPGLDGMVTAAGAFKQRLYVIPGRRMVVVRLGNSAGPQFEDARFLGLLTGAVSQ